MITGDVIPLQKRLQRAAQRCRRKPVFVRRPTRLHANTSRLWRTLRENLNAKLADSALSGEQNSVADVVGKCCQDIEYAGLAELNVLVD